MLEVLPGQFYDYNYLQLLKGFVILFIRGLNFLSLLTYYTGYEKKQWTLKNK